MKSLIIIIISMVGMLVAQAHRMDTDQAERRRASYLQALQTWERTQGLIADAVALCEAAFAAQARSEELRLLRSTMPRS
jgi:hypothetical protein